MKKGRRGPRTVSLLVGLCRVAFNIRSHGRSAHSPLLLCPSRVALFSPHAPRISMPADSIFLCWVCRGVSRAGGSGRAAYISDVAALCQSLRVPWTYWSGRTISRGSSAGPPTATSDFGLLAVTVNFSAGTSARFAWDDEALGSLGPYLSAKAQQQNT